MQLKILSYQDCEQVRLWRNETLAMNRTPFLLTENMQARFYNEQVCNRQANARYWGIWIDEPHMELVRYEYNCGMKLDEPIVMNEKVPYTFVGMGEISNIQWENRLGEIGLIMHPEHLDKADKAINLILEQGFDYLNLENIFGEVYVCSPYLDIWANIATKYNAAWCYLLNRKYWNGKYFGSKYFNILREDWKKCKLI
jgi:hypothetical protein